MSNSVFPYLDVETCVFELEKVEFLLSLTDGEYSPDQTWALISGAKALCVGLRAKMEKIVDKAPGRDRSEPATVEDRRRAA